MLLRQNFVDEVKRYEKQSWKKGGIWLDSILFLFSLILENSIVLRFDLDVLPSNIHSEVNAGIHHIYSYVKLNKQNRQSITDDEQPARISIWDMTNRLGSSNLTNFRWHV